MDYIARDKRGLPIEIDDTVVVADADDIVFVEVGHIGDGFIIGHDFDDNTWVIQGKDCLSICACYRDMRHRIAHEVANG